jgi:hypothetical protein
MFQSVSSHHLRYDMEILNAKINLIFLLKKHNSFSNLGLLQAMLRTDKRVIMSSLTFNYLIKVRSDILIKCLYKLLLEREIWRKKLFSHK